MDLDAWMLDKFPLDLGKGMKEEAKVSNSPFVILHHTGHFSQDRRDHWDWLIRFPESFLAELAPRMQACHGEHFPGLLAFASETPPNQWSGGTKFWRLAPHRMKYLEYEGEISRGRGSVKRIASGELQWIFFSDFQLQFRLFRLGWLDDCQHSHWFRPESNSGDPPGRSLGASINSTPGQYSLTHALGKSQLGDSRLGRDKLGRECVLPWTAQGADSEPFWRFS